MTRIALVLPLLWVFVLSQAFAAEKATTKKGKRRASEKAQAASLAESQVHSFGDPVAVLAAPSRQVRVFRLTSAEKSDWSYMVVVVDEDGIRRGYGDEKTVGGVLEQLTQSLRPATAVTPSRCPASNGWTFTSPGLNTSYCAESLETQRIERAIGLLEASPAQ